MSCEYTNKEHVARVAMVRQGPRLNWVFEELGVKYEERVVPEKLCCAPAGKVATPKADVVPS
jgi:hypothetical protein